MQNWYLHFSLNKTDLYFVYLKKNLKYKIGHELCISQVPPVKDLALSGWKGLTGILVQLGVHENLLDTAAKHQNSQQVHAHWQSWIGNERHSILLTFHINKNFRIKLYFHTTLSRKEENKICIE